MKSKTKKIIIIVSAVVLFYAVSITGFIFASKWLNSIDDAAWCDVAEKFMVADGTFEDEHGSIESVKIDKSNKMKHVSDEETHIAFIVTTEKKIKFRVWISTEEFNDGLSSGDRYSYVSIEKLS